MDVSFNIYHYENRIKSTLEAIESSSQICDENKAAILRFYSNCLAEGLTNARISKLLHHVRQIAKLLNKDFAAASKDDIMQLVREIETNPSWSQATKHDYRVILKKLYKSLDGSEEFPDKVKWIKPNSKKSNHMLPEELLTPEDIRKLVDASVHPRDKAFVLVLYESGCRIGELLNLRVKNVQFDAIGAALIVNGKTGQRRVRIIASAPLLSVWLDNHPFRSNPDAPLWITVGTKNHHGALQYGAAVAQLREIARRATVYRKVNPHAFRHARATFLANN